MPVAVDAAPSPMTPATITMLNQNNDAPSGASAKSKIQGGGADAKKTTKELLASIEKRHLACIQKQLAKTKFCKFYLGQGVCRYGSSCIFAHSCLELKRTPDLRKTRACRNFKDGNCTDASCPFAHGGQELRVTDACFKKTLCRWYSLGRCRAGEKCRFAHGDIELRSAMEIAEDELKNGSADGISRKATSAGPSSASVSHGPSSGSGTGSGGPGSAGGGSGNSADSSHGGSGGGSTFTASSSVERERSDSRGSPSRHMRGNSRDGEEPQNYRGGFDNDTMYTEDEDEEVQREHDQQQSQKSERHAARAESNKNSNAATGKAQNGSKLDRQGKAASKVSLSHEGVSELLSHEDLGPVFVNDRLLDANGVNVGPKKVLRHEAHAATHHERHLNGIHSFDVFQPNHHQHDPKHSAEAGDLAKLAPSLDQVVNRARHLQQQLETLRTIQCVNSAIGLLGSTSSQQRQQQHQQHIMEQQHQQHQQQQLQHQQRQQDFQATQCLAALAQNVQALGQQLASLESRFVNYAGSGGSMPPGNPAPPPPMATMTMQQRTEAVQRGQAMRRNLADFHGCLDDEVAAQHQAQLAAHAAQNMQQQQHMQQQQNQQQQHQHAQHINGVAPPPGLPLANLMNSSGPGFHC